MPLVGPALVTLAIVNALWAWNELLIAVVMLQREESRTLQAGLALLKGKNTMDIPLVMAGASSLPSRCCCSICLGSASSCVGCWPAPSRNSVCALPVPAAL